MNYQTFETKVLITLKDELNKTNKLTESVPTQLGESL